jgi:hypothetical protein
MSVPQATVIQKVSHPPLRPKYGFLGPDLLRKPILIDWVVKMGSSQIDRARAREQQQQSRSSYLKNGQQDIIHVPNATSLHGWHVHLGGLDAFVQRRKPCTVSGDGNVRGLTEGSSNRCHWDQDQASKTGKRGERRMSPSPDPAGRSLEIEVRRRRSSVFPQQNEEFRHLIEDDESQMSSFRGEP